MSFLWNLSLDDYLKICEKAKDNGVKEGESIEKYILEYMKEKGQKPICETNKDIDMICGDLREENPGIKILNLNEIKRRKDNNESQK